MIDSKHSVQQRIYLDANKTIIKMIRAKNIIPEIHLCVIIFFWPSAGKSRISSLPHLGHKYFGKAILPIKPSQKKLAWFSTGEAHFGQFMIPSSLFVYFNTVLYQNCFHKVSGSAGHTMKSCFILLSFNFNIWASPQISDRPITYTDHKSAAGSRCLIGWEIRSRACT